MSKERSTFQKNKLVAAYLFILPFFLMFCFFLAFPVVQSFLLSFHKWIGIGPKDFVAFDNYIKLAGEDRFREALINNIILALSGIFIILPISLLFALLLAKRLQVFKGFFRVALFSPVVFSAVVIGISFQMIFTERFGLLNNILNLININGLPWINSPKYALLSLIIVLLWRYTGYNMIFFIAGLQNIPLEHYESASIDGANNWQLFRYITLPQMRHTFSFIIILSLIGSFTLFGEPYVLTGGGPQDSTLTLAILLYETAFRFNKLGFGSAVAYAIFFIILLITLIQMKVLRVHSED